MHLINIFHVLHELILQIRVFAPTRCFNLAAALFRTCIIVTLSIPVYSGQWPSGIMDSTSEPQGCSKVKSAVYPLRGQSSEQSISLPVLVLNETNLVMTIRYEAGNHLQKQMVIQGFFHQKHSFNTSSSKSGTTIILCCMTRNNPIHYYRTDFSLGLHIERYLFSL